MTLCLQINLAITGWAAPANLNHVAESIKKKRAVPINEFDITHDVSSNTWFIIGEGLERFVQMTNWRYAKLVRCASLSLSFNFVIH